GVFWVVLRVLCGCKWFFFSSRRRHTSLVSDWSSDVCSSDLRPCHHPDSGLLLLLLRLRLLLRGRCRGDDKGDRESEDDRERELKIGRASCRERGEGGVGATSVKKKKRQRGVSEANECEGGVD